MRCVGIDVGTKRVGFAVTVEGTSLVMPRETVAANKATGYAVELVREVGAQAIVVGLPLQLDGSRGRAAALAQGFVERLTSALEEAELDVEIILEDERLSTQASHVLLTQAGVSSKRRKAMVDQLAAVDILQSYVDRTQR